jgi:peptidyl-prolyl cis-trans isomerase B (cyclophilin B)
MDTNAPSTADPTLDDKIKQWVRSTATVLVVGLAAYGIYSMVRSNQESKESEAWLSFHDYTDAPRTPTGSGPAISSVNENLRKWAELDEANRPLRDMSTSDADLSKVRLNFDALNRNSTAGPAASGILDASMSAKAVIASIDALQAFEKENPSLLRNPEPAADNRARIVTDAGTFEISFFPGAAPEHVANFRKLVGDGFYSGTKFHRITRSGIFVVQGGDPNSKEGAPATWGQGSLGDGIPVERNSLLHTRGTVAMAQPSSSFGAKKSSGCQFYIVTADSRSLDREYTVFGVVTSGMDVVDKIAAGEVEAGSERPKSPVVVTQTVIF